MPSKNSIKAFGAPAYYHVYNRGAGGQPIFYSDQDRQKFLSLLARHLDTGDDSQRTDGIQYEKYDLELLAYCLMGNHFHLLLYQEVDVRAITKLMRSVATAYSMYFNLRHKQSGHLFQGVFKAVEVSSDAYLMHITRYIHMNPRSYLRYKWSSIGYYLGKEPPAWLKHNRINTMTPEKYRDFLDSYEGKKIELQHLKDQLAG